MYLHSLFSSSTDQGLKQSHWFLICLPDFLLGKLSNPLHHFREHLLMCSRTGQCLIIFLLENRTNNHTCYSEGEKCDSVFSALNFLIICQAHLAENVQAQRYPCTLRYKTTLDENIPAFRDFRSSNGVLSHFLWLGFCLS